MSEFAESSDPARLELPAYAELHCRSNFSFLTGASHPEELVDRAVRLGYTALAITDECSLSGVVRAHAQALDQGLHLIIGSEMKLTPEPADRPAAGPSGTPFDKVPTPRTPLRLVLLARSRRGYGHLSQWITVARRRAEKGHYLAHAGDLEGRVLTAPTLAGLPECWALLVPDASQSLDEIAEHARWLKAWFQDRAVLAYERLHRPGDALLRERVIRVSRLTDLPITAAGDVLMHLRSRKPLQDTLTATRLKLPLSECGWQLEPNAEQHLRSRARLADLYEAEWLRKSVELAAGCNFSLRELKYEYPEEIVPPGETPTSHLRALSQAGALRRFPSGLKPELAQQLETELALIKQLKYEAYFLTVADIVSWARSQGILCQGRGSAANSLVCFCLGVTEVDPERSTLLFERFISVERNEPPDIDIDFEHQQRERVIQYIYAKYGRHRAALTAVVIRYRPRSALRDAGRALGLDLQAIEAVSKGQKWFDGRKVDAERLREQGFDPEAPITRLWMELTHQLIDFPRHLSQHPGGFLIARHRIEDLVPVENAAMEDRSVVQWDKDDLDLLGLIKVDILALGMLSALRRALELLSTKLGRPFGMQDVPEGDAATYDMICAADTVGVFQIESRAQMNMLPRLKPRCFYDLVVEVAIVRPGPMQGGMVHPYLQNRGLSDDEIDCPAEILPALKRTFGVPIFQEQVMQIAMLAADFTGGEADQLRRAMAAWKRKGGLAAFHDKLVGRMVAKGYDRDYAERIFHQIEGFGEYGFPESHAAGFALLAYVSSWIKRHHPDVFLAALLNSQPMGFYAPAQLVRDARAHGVVVMPVDVTQSHWDSTLDNLSAPLRRQAEDAPSPLKAVRLGLHLVGGLSVNAAERIVRAREAASFADPADLARRAGLSRSELDTLAQADALQTLLTACALQGHRHQAAWAVAGIDTHAAPLLRETPVPEVPSWLPAPTAAEDTLADYRALGLTLKAHPLTLLRAELNRFKVQTAEVLRAYPADRLARASGLVTHRQRPPTAKGTMFLTLEDDTGTINVIAWPRVVETLRLPLLASTLLTVFGRWQSHSDAGGTPVMHLIAIHAIDHSALLTGLISRSRDFR